MTKEVEHKTYRYSAKDYREIRVSIVCNGIRYFVELEPDQGEAIIMKRNAQTLEDAQKLYDGLARSTVLELMRVASKIGIKHVGA